MGLFGFGTKGKDVVDLAERYRQKKEMEATLGEGITDELDSTDGNLDERRKRLAKRLIDMTNRLDDLSNKIYHLQQRIEVLERKADIKTEEKEKLDES